METRRGFLQKAGIGAAGALLFPGIRPAIAQTVAVRDVSIVGVVNASQALADDALTGNIFWFDNNAAGGSRFLGTDHLVTAIAPGAGVTWIVDALEVETFAEIKNMTGAGARLTGAAERSDYDGAVTYWEGRVAADAKGEYTYDLSLTIHGRAMAIPAALTLVVA